MAFGMELKKMIEKKNISAAELCRRTGIPKTTLSSMFKNDVNKIDIDIFLKICDALDCDPQSFYYNYRNDNNIYTDLSGNEKKIIDKFRLLNSDGENAALEYLDFLAATAKYKKCDTVSKVS